MSLINRFPDGNDPLKGVSSKNTNSTEGAEKSSKKEEITIRLSGDSDAEEVTGNKMLADADDEFLDALEKYNSGSKNSLSDEQKSDLQKNPAHTRDLSYEQRIEAYSLEADRAGLTGENRDAYIKMRFKSNILDNKIAQKNKDREPNSEKNKLLNDLAQDVANGEKIFFKRDENGMLGPNPKFANLDAEELNEVLTRAKKLEPGKTNSSDTTTANDKTSSKKAQNNKDEAEKLAIETELTKARTELLKEEARLTKLGASSSSDVSEIKNQTDLAKAQAELEKAKAELEKAKAELDAIKRNRNTTSSSRTRSSRSSGYRHRDTEDWAYYKRTFGTHYNGNYRYDSGRYYDSNRYDYDDGDRRNGIQQFTDFANDLNDGVNTTVRLFDSLYRLFHGGKDRDGNRYWY